VDLFNSIPMARRYGMVGGGRLMDGWLDEAGFDIDDAGGSCCGDFVRWRRVDGEDE